MMVVFSFNRSLVAMFALFSHIKRLTSRHKSATSVPHMTHGGKKVETSPIFKQENEQEKKHDVERQRKQFLTELQQIAHDEAAVVALLLACDFADGRLQAAQHVHTQQALTQVRNAMRNHDRRVAKLVQSKLDLMQHAAQMRQKMQDCIQQAEQLATQEQILANQVNQLDKQRGAAGAAGTAGAVGAVGAVGTAGALDDMPELLARYQQVRALVEQKFQAQTQLQRQTLDLLQQLRDQAASLAALENGVQEESAQLVMENLAQQEARMAAISNHPMQASLPKNLLADCVSAFQSCHQLLQQRMTAIHAEKQKNADQIQEVDKVAAKSTSDVLAEAQTVPEHHHQDIEVIQDGHRNAVQTQNETNPVSTPHSDMSSKEVSAALQAFEEALEQGSVQNAKRYDRQLRDAEAAMDVLDAKQRERLLKLRTELNHLLAWAKWGGNVSRDELIRAVEELATENLAASQLAKKITALRERWKEMERLSGAASQELWARFDAACNTAYAPAAQYFQQQAEERKANLALAEQFLITMQEQADALLSTEANWKACAQFCQTQLTAWKKIGHVDRKQRTRLDATFESLFQRIWQPLQARRAEEILSRQTMIEEVAALDAQQRGALDQLRQLQERWQKQAAQVPLKRQDEQRLWEAFRAACDAVFAQRKQFAATADAQRLQNRVNRQALCEALEQTLSALNAAISNASLQDVAQVEQSGNRMKEAQKLAAVQWRELGAVPKADEAALEQRFQQINANIKNSLSTWQARKKSVQKVQSLKALQLCWQLENALQNFRDDVLNEQSALEMEALYQKLMQEWSAIHASGKSAIVQQLASRFTAGIKLFQSCIQERRQLPQSQQYVAALVSNQAIFDADLLRLEILCGVDSPSELAKERLHLQVEVLQASLKNGQSAQYKHAVFGDLLKLPVQLDAGRQARFEKMMAQYEMN